MIKSWLRPMEQIILSARARNARVLAFTGIDKASGVDVLCEELADALQKSGVDTLLMQLATGAGDAAGASAGDWSPASLATTKSITRHSKGFDFLKAGTSPDIQFRFNNLELLKSAFNTDLAKYKAIIVALPVVGRELGRQINPVAVASACDSVYLVCRTGGTSRQKVEDAVKQLRNGGVQLSGTILDDAAVVTPASSILQKLKRLERLAPRTKKRLERMVSGSELLN